MKKTSFHLLWEEIADIAPFAAPAGLGAHLSRYRDELSRWNEKINLVRFSDDRELAVRHFLDSLAAVAFLPFGAKVVDVGSGAGFPGLVIALARPDLRMMLVEKRRKRAHFLWHIRRELGAQNVEIKAIRAEHLPERAFDAATGRAAAKPGQFLDLISPKVKIGGAVYCWLAPRDAEELPAERIENLFRYTLPGEDKERALARLKVV